MLEKNIKKFIIATALMGTLVPAGIYAARENDKDSKEEAATQEELAPAHMSAQELNDEAEAYAQNAETALINRLLLPSEEQKEINEWLINTITLRGNYGLEEITEIIQMGADVNALDDIKASALSHAIVEEGHEVVKSLLLAHANPNTINKYGYSPLYLSVSHKCLGIEKLLVLQGADPYLAHGYEPTPLDIASKNIKNTLLEALAMRQKALQRLDRAATLLQNGVTENPALSVIDYISPIDTYLYFSEPTDEFLTIRIAQKWLAIKKNKEISRVLSLYSLMPQLVNIIDQYLNLAINNTD